VIDELAVLREELTRARQEAARERQDREQLLETMRTANERLILASLRSEALHERLAAALDASGTGTFRYDGRSRRLEADDNMRALFGVGDGEPCDQLEDLLARIDPDDRDEVARRLERALAEEADVDLSFRVPMADGGTRWLGLRGRVRAGAAETPTYMLGACIDSTDRKRAAEARAANRAKDQFLAILGHELRNPLAPIRTALHVLNRKAAQGDPNTARERGVIERQVEHLVRLVDDLLDVARISQGKITLEPERVDVAEVVATALELAGSLLEQRQHRVEVEVPRGELVVDGDRARLAQIAANLLTNAAKYTPAGGRIRVTARREGAAIELAVSDDGIGIPRHLLPHVFDLFVQGERAADRGEGGLGIGLTIVNSLVAMHGGTIRAASAGVGQGATFTVTLPVSSGVPLEVTRAASSGVRARHQRRVLIVDDNVDVAELMADVLRDQGHEVAVAHDGAAALRLAETFRPEAALVDIGLPVMDGYELAVNLRARLGVACPRLIAITGYGQPGDRVRTAAAGFERHLVKPVDVDRLLALVAE
jgi:PAS domain S-box-containing protein